MFDTTVQDIKSQLKNSLGVTFVREDFQTDWTNDNNIRSRNSRRLKMLLNKRRNIYSNRSCKDFACIFNTSMNNMKNTLSECGIRTINHPLVEHFERPKGKDLVERLRYFVKEKIIVLTHPKLNLIDSIIDKKFYIKKITVSFVNPLDAKWKDERRSKTTSVQQGNELTEDPIQQKIVGMTPQDAVKTIIRERIEPLTNIRFEFIEDDDIHKFHKVDPVVRIGFNPKDGNWSLVGMYNLFSSSKTTMNLGNFDSATIIHEFMHVLGLLHEHQQSNGKPIEWNKPLLYSWAKRVHGWNKSVVDRNIINKYSKDQINGTNFDPESIMLYYFPKELTLDGKGTSQNKVLSETDVKYALLKYGGHKKKEWRKIYKQMYGIEPKSSSSSFWESIRTPLFMSRQNLVILSIIVLIGVFISVLRSSKWSTHGKMVFTLCILLGILVLYKHYYKK